MNENEKPQGGQVQGGGGGGGNQGRGGGGSGAPPPKAQGGGGKPNAAAPQKSWVAIIPLLLSVVFTTVTLFLLFINKLVTPACAPAFNGAIPAGCTGEVWTRIGILAVVAIIFQALLFQQRYIRHPGWRGALAGIDTFTNVVGLGWLTIYPLGIASGLRPWIDAIVPLVTLERIITFILLLLVGVLWRGLDDALRN